MYSPSKLEDLLEMRGELRLLLTGEDGQVKEDVSVPNLVVSVGKGLIANRMQAAPTQNAMSHVAVGTTGTAPAAGDTQLGAEVAGSRTALTSATVAAAIITYVAQLAPGVGTGALVEAGLFNAAAAGQMLARTTFAVINKAAGDTLNITWTVTVG
jgi:hypothetical protein